MNVRLVPSSTALASPRRSPLAFCVLVFALSLPLWLIGWVAGVELFPGLPLAALMVVCPAVAALILVYRETSVAAAVAFAKHALDHKGIHPGWYAPIFLLMPGVVLASYGLLRPMGTPLPVPNVSAAVALVMIVLFFAGAICEEIGWSGYATEPLQERFGALRAGLLLGAIWAVWHFVPLLEAHRSPAWIAWWSLFTVALRVLIVWIYNNTGKSVFAAALFHAASNACTVLLPIEFEIVGPALAVVAAFVIVVWGPRTLIRPGKLE